MHKTQTAMKKLNPHYPFWYASTSMLWKLPALSRSLSPAERVALQQHVAHAEGACAVIQVQLFEQGASLRRHDPRAHMRASSMDECRAAFDRRHYALRSPDMVTTLDAVCARVRHDAHAVLVYFALDADPFVACDVVSRSVLLHELLTAAGGRGATAFEVSARLDLVLQHDVASNARAQAAYFQALQTHHPTLIVVGASGLTALSHAQIKDPSVARCTEAAWRQGGVLVSLDLDLDLDVQAITEPAKPIVVERALLTTKFLHALD
jgi:hypothetical protein